MLLHRVTDVVLDHFFVKVREHFGFLLGYGFVEGSEFDMGSRETSLEWVRADERIVVTRESTGIWVTRLQDGTHEILATGAVAKHRRAEYDRALAALAAATREALDA